MSAHDAAIERELHVLHRRSARLDDNDNGGPSLDRSHYAILGHIHDHGAQRIGQIARAFDLDPSTLTRQVQSAIALGLASRHPDPDDWRATVLKLTELGSSTVEAVREARGAKIAGLLERWEEDDRETFLRLLARFNADAANWSRPK